MVSLEIKPCSSWTYLSPINHENMVPSIDIIIAIKRDKSSPLIKDGPKILGKKELELILERTLGGIEERTLGGITEIGLIPRKAPNKAPDGGICDRNVASCFGRPKDTEVLYIADGRSCENIVIVMEKNIAMLIVEVMLFIVILIPLADALSLDETAFIIAVVFGEANNPPPIPIMNKTISNSNKLKL